jgi:predicted RNase H-like HicB family nuclease
MWLMTRVVLRYLGVDGFIVAEIPSLPGCISQGRTSDEALANVREAISLHEEVLRERGEPVPGDVQWRWLCRGGSSRSGETRLASKP